jgi:hypothetical protein
MYISGNRPEICIGILNNYEGKHFMFYKKVVFSRTKYIVMSQRRKQIIAWILFLVFALYYANICFFSHSHVINGATIIHSHFHSEAHTQTGTHSNSELTLISALSTFQSLQATLCLVSLGLFLSLQVLILPFFEKQIIINTSDCISLRAPPALF